MKINYEGDQRSHFVVLRFRDGDTAEGLLVCRSCGCARKLVIRIPDIDSWEPAGDTAARATLVARELTDKYRGRIGVLTKSVLRQDIYGRSISDVIIDGTTLSVQLVNSGHAWYGVGRTAPETRE